MQGRRIRAVLFDLGNVLIPFSHDRMVKQVAACLGLDEAEIRAMLMEGGLLRAYEQGQISTEEMYRLITKGAPRVPALEALSRAASDIFWPNPQMEEVASSLVKKGLPVAIVSNTCPIHIAWIERRFPFFNEIPYKVLSYEVGVSKPALAIYETALQVVGTQPGEAVFFDDRPENVEGAMALGIRAYLYESPAQVVRVLSEHGVL